MNKWVISLISLAALAFVTGLIVFSGDQPDSLPQANDSTVVTNTETTSGNTPSSQTSGGVYTSYSETALGEAETDNVVLFFHAKWCTVCRAVIDNIKQSGVPNDLTILEVDIDNSNGLVEKYKVPFRGQFVQVDSQGNEIKQWSGYDYNYGIAQIQQELKQT